MPAEIKEDVRLYADHYTSIGADGAVLVDQLRVAMMHQKAVSFVYDDKERIVEVHAIGLSTKDGSVLFRGYQVAGQASRPLPQWTLFSLSKVQALTTTFVASEAPREGYAMNDKQMAPVLCQLVL